VILSNAELNIPGGISPNDDGYNDVWKITGIEQWTDYVVELRNMRGELVYKQDATDNPSYIAFDGLNQQGQKLPPGDYTYFLSSKKRKKRYSGILSIKYDY
jgi:gliding motility-associated-like protein